MNWVRYLLIIIITAFAYTPAWCQQKDTIPIGVVPAKDSVLHFKQSKKSSNIDSPYKVDSATRKKHDPRKATLYSAVCPGLGQIYNRKYWKLPIIAAAIGIPIYTYFYNKSWFLKCQYAIAFLNNNDTPFSQKQLASIDPQLRIFVTNGDINDLLTNRNSFRQNEDYSVLFFLIFWGLNVVDATVDAHLRDFDVSSELSLRLEPTSATPGGGFAMSNTTGLSLVFDLHKARFKPIALP